MRWCVGFKQVFVLYSSKLLKQLVTFKNKPIQLISNYTNILPICITLIINFVLYLLTCFLIFLNCYVNYDLDVQSPYFAFLCSYVFCTPLYIFGTIFINFLIWSFITVVKNWNKINTTAKIKIISIFTYPFFMFTYLPISFLSLFKKTYSTTPIKRKEQQ